MLRKKENRQDEWDRLLKFLLFAYRQAPHANTGYSPFELIYGRQVQGPLDVVRTVGCQVMLAYTMCVSG